MVDEEYQGGRHLEIMRQVAGSAGIGGSLLLLFGLYYLSNGLKGTSDSALYNASVDAKVWTLILGGVASLGCAILLWLGWARSLIVDAFAAIGIGLMLVILGLFQASYSLRSGLMDIEALLMIIFGSMFVRSGWGSWIYYRGFRPSVTPPVAVAEQPVRVEGLKESARERLLQAKANLRNSGTEAPASAPAADEPVPTGEKVTTMSEASVAAPATDTGRPVAIVQPEQAAKPAASEPVEDGFLAELGRRDANERK